MKKKSLKSVLKIEKSFTKKQKIDFFCIELKKDLDKSMNELEIYRNMTAMIVEDDIQAASDLQEVLDEIFFEVTLAHNGEVALELFFEKKPEILFVDIMMPQKNGLELIKEIRTVDKEVKIIIISGYNSPEYLMEAVKLKLEDYLIKPIKYEPFINLLKQIANNCKEKYPNKIFLSTGAIFEPFNKSVTFENNTYILTKSEFKLLMFLISNKNNLLSKELLENHLWYGGSTSETALKSLINKLRKKIGKDAIESHSGFGYKVVL